MKDLFTKHDPNFKINEAFGEREVILRSCRKPPFSVHGLFHDGELFRRLPAELADSVSEGVGWASKATAGGRIRFRTDSPFVAIHLMGPYLCLSSQSAAAGSAGVDLYADGIFVKTYLPPLDRNSFSGIIELGEAKMREIMLELPLYSFASDVEIGLAPNAALEPPTPYRNPIPAVFYGSSITEGGCASRPGSCYAAFVSRHFDLDYVNLGFSGSAKGEEAMADYIAGMEMSVFFLDYDHNAPSPEHLKRTHEPFFLRVREAHPNLPIIMMSRPKPSFVLDAHEVERLAIIRTTYENALARGDKNVYFLDGDTLMAIAGNEGTVDGCHPTDLGFFSMAQAVIDLVEREGILQ